MERREVEREYEHIPWPSSYYPGMDGYPRGPLTKETKMSLEETLKERGSRYGAFPDNAYIAQELKLVVRQQANWNSLDHTYHEAIDNILQKIARIMSGDPDYPDNWHDIQGYAKLAEDFAKEPKG